MTETHREALDRIMSSWGEAIIEVEVEAEEDGLPLSDFNLHLSADEVRAVYDAVLALLAEPAAVPHPPQEPTPEAVERAAWQPIETAPKDGTRVDLWEGNTRWTDMVWIDSSPRDPNGAWARDTSDWCNAYEWLKPTHWMPLPDAPAPA